jgi:hypothetical protein
VHASHGLALAALPLLSVPSSLTLLFSVLLLFAWRRALRPSTWRLLVGCMDGRWTLIDMRGMACHARLVSGSVVHPYLVVLPLRLDGGCRLRLALFHDALDTADHAALRRALAVARPEGVGAVSS